MKHKRLTIGLRPYLTFVVLIEFFLTIFLSISIMLLARALGWTLNIPRISLIMFASFGCTSILASILNRTIFKPIRILSEAMRRVASGDFKIHLTTATHVKDIQDIYNNFNIMVKELDATEVLQSDFVSNVSHEFKTPINAIEGYATLLQGTQQSTPEQAQYIEKILFNTRRLSELVGNVLLLSKVENSSMPLDCAPYRLDEQIRQAILMFERQWVERDIEFDVDMENIIYNGNSVIMLHVWSNLISNAIKFNRQGGMIRIRLYRQGKDIQFTIDDEGPGISENAISHVFDKFYQEDNSHKQEGNGLGLSVTKQILTAVGGQINAENLPDAGCRFTVVLPA